MDRFSENFRLYKTVSASQKGPMSRVRSPSQNVKCIINSDLALGLHLNHSKVKINLCWNVNFVISLRTGETAFTNISSTRTARGASCFGYKSAAAARCSTIKDIAL